MPTTIAELRRQLDESQQRERALAEQIAQLVAALAAQTRAFEDQRAAMEELTQQLKRDKRRSFGKVVR